MKSYEVREMSTDEIEKRIVEEEKNLIELKFQHELKQLTNTAKLGSVRRDIARMKTELKKRELQQETQPNKE